MYDKRTAHARNFESSVRYSCALQTARGQLDAPKDQCHVTSNGKFTSHVPSSVASKLYLAKKRYFSEKKKEGYRLAVRPAGKHNVRNAPALVNSSLNYRHFSRSGVRGKYRIRGLCWLRPPSAFFAVPPSLLAEPRRNLLCVYRVAFEALSLPMITAQQLGATSQRFPLPAPPPRSFHAANLLPLLHKRRRMFPLGTMCRTCHSARSRFTAVV